MTDNQPRSGNRRGNGGFTIVEMMVASTVSVLAFSLASIAFIGMQEAARIAIEQAALREKSANTVEKLGRRIMEATRIQIRPEEADLGIVRLWRDEQEIWTPETTDDDIESLIYYEEDSRELRFRPNLEDPAEDVIISTDVDEIRFEMIGEALFVEITMDYDIEGRVETPTEEPDPTKRHIYCSFAIRNNPRVRVGATR